MMVGLPGAGKSTWARENHSELPIISKDDIREEFGFKKINEKGPAFGLKEGIVVETFWKRILENVKSGKDVVVDDPSNTRGLRDKIKKLLKDFDIHWIYVWVEAPDIETNIKRREGQLPKGFIRLVQKSFQPPTEDEYDEIIHIKQTKTNEKD